MNKEFKQILKSALLLILVLVITVGSTMGCGKNSDPIIAASTSPAHVDDLTPSPTPSPSPTVLPNCNGAVQSGKSCQMTDLRAWVDYKVDFDIGRESSFLVTPVHCGSYPGALILVGPGIPNFILLTEQVVLKNMHGEYRMIGGLALPQGCSLQFEAQ